MKKERVDVLLVQQGLFDSREQAKRAVMAGEILGKNNERLDKPGQKIPITTTLHMKGHKMPYVSRGGLKTTSALCKNPTPYGKTDTPAQTWPR